MRWHLAQLNQARAVAPLDSPAMADFVAQIGEVNALAEAHPGFVWRWEDDPPPGTDPRLLINVSLWRSVDDLADFAMRGRHGEALKQRRRWFEPGTTAQTVLWWVEAGTRPTLTDGFARLARLQAEGPSPAAFTFARRYPPPA